MCPPVCAPGGEAGPQALHLRPVCGPESCSVLEGGGTERLRPGGDLHHQPLGGEALHVSAGQAACAQEMRRQAHNQVGGGAGVGWEVWVKWVESGWEGGCDGRYQRVTAVK